MFEHLPKQRRTILKALLAGATTAFLAPFASAVRAYLSFTGGPLAGSSAKMSEGDLTPSEPWKLLEIAGEPVIVLRTESNTIRAFTATCTHLGCTVAYRPAEHDFYCKCHRGRFDENGINVPGTKPKSPLTELKIAEDGGDVEVFLTPKKEGA